MASPLRVCGVKRRKRRAPLAVSEAFPLIRLPRMVAGSSRVPIVRPPTTKRPGAGA
jgi:hypothetical protein